jgi:membrane protein
MLRASVVQWTEDHVPRRAAALAFYAGFSLAPLLLIAIAIGGFAFGSDAVRGRVVEQLQGLLGRRRPRGGAALKARTTGSSLWPPSSGVVTLFVGASGVFGELQDALNEIWKVRKKPGLGLREILRSRFLSFTFVVGSGFLLLVSLIVSAVLEAATRLLESRFAATGLLRAVSAGVSFAVVGTMFAMMFKILPDARTRWRDVWLGAGVTAVLFTIGKWLIGLYLGHSALASSHGAADRSSSARWAPYCQPGLSVRRRIRACAREFGTGPARAGGGESEPERSSSQSRKEAASVAWRQAERSTKPREAVLPSLGACCNFSQRRGARGGFPFPSAPSRVGYIDESSKTGMGCSRSWTRCIGVRSNTRATCRNPFRMKHRTAQSHSHCVFRRRTSPLLGVRAS